MSRLTVIILTLFFISLSIRLTLIYDIFYGIPSISELRIQQHHMFWSTLNILNVASCLFAFGGLATYYFGYKKNGLKQNMNLISVLIFYVLLEFVVCSVSLIFDNSYAFKFS